MLGLSGVLVLLVLIIIYVVAFSSTEEENEGFDPEVNFLSIFWGVMFFAFDEYICQIFFT